MSAEAQAKRGMWVSVPPKVRLLILSQLLNGFAFGYFLIFIAAFLPETGTSAVVVAAIIGIEGITVVLAGIPFAILSDKKGRKWFLILGNVLFAPTILVFALTRSVGIFYVAAALGGIGEAMVLSSWNAMIADQTDLTNRDSAFSLSFITGGASFALGAALPLAFPTVEAMTGMSSYAVHSGALLALGLLNFATPLMFWTLLRDHKEEFLEEKTEGLKLGGMGQTLKFSLINSIIGFGAGLIIPLLATWLLYKFQVTDTYSGPFLAIAGLTIAFSAFASPRVSKRLGLFPAILAAAGSSTVFMLSLAFVPNVFLAGGLYVVRSGLMNMNAPLMDSFLMGITPPKRRGLASTLNAVIWRLPNNGSTFIGGFLLATNFTLPWFGLTNFDIPWVLATVLYATGIGLLYLTFRNVKPAI